MFVSVWIDQHLHFGETTTNRVESQHSKLKKYLEGSSYSLDRFVGCIDKIVESQHTIIKESLEKSRVVRYHHHNIRCFTLLRGLVSNEALDKILEDRDRLKNRKYGCDCRLRTSCGLPCSCEIMECNNSGQYISLDSIDIFWRKLDISPSTFVEDDDVSCDSELQQFKENFNKQSKIGKKSLLRKLMAIIVPTTTDTREPRVQKNTRGRPTSKKTEQKRRSNPVHQDSRRYSCSSMPHYVRKSSAKEPERHSSCEINLNKEPVIDLNEDPYEFESSDMFDLNEVPTTKSSSMFDDIPTTKSYSMFDDIPHIFHPYIMNIYNVIGDGNCGYRALAVSLGFDQGYYETIRHQMRDELRSRYNMYEAILGTDTEPLFRTLCFTGSPCPPEYWMKMPEAGVLIANMFGVIVLSLSISGSTTIFPFWNGPEEFQHHRVVTIAHVDGNHFVMVDLQGEYPMPLVTAYWNHYIIHPSAARWETIYRSRIQSFSEFYRRESSFVNLGD